MLTLSHILAELDVAEDKTIVMRHAPGARDLRAFMGIVRRRQDLLDAYQRTQFSRAETPMTRADWLVSCAGEEPHKALFVGVFRIIGFESVNVQEQFALPEVQEVHRLVPGPKGWRDNVPETVLRFDLHELDATKDYSARLVLKWGGMLAWWKWAHRNRFEIVGLRSQAEIDPPVPDWRGWVIPWAELAALPRRSEEALSQWRGIYHIFDTASNKGYVGSAGGAENILGRWRNYSVDGHGGNMGLRGVEAGTLVFSILERTSPDLPLLDLVQLESSWKDRLMTRRPHGLNHN